MKRQLLRGSVSFALTLGLGMGGLIQGTMAQGATAQGSRELSPHAQPQIQSPTDLAQRSSIVFCDVINIRTGQLAVRFAPGGSSRAGLNNGNVVRFIRSEGIWYYIEVIEGPNQRVRGVQGWVNSNYLRCDVV